MGKLKIPGLLICLISLNLSLSSQPSDPGKSEISVEWKEQNASGIVEVLNCSLEKINIYRGIGKISGNKFSFSSRGANRLDITIKEAELKPGSGAAVITINAGTNPFSFFLRDIDKDFPVLIPGYGVAVTVSEDKRTYLQIESDLMQRSVKAQMKYADKIGARFSLVIGDDEISNNSAKIKDMKNGTSEEVNFDALEEYLKVKTEA